MNMNNNYLNEDYVVDIELSRFEKLVEEREAYEEEFLSMEPPVDDIIHLIEEYCNQTEFDEVTFSFNDFEVDVVNPLEYDDRLIQLRDEKLIKEREEYESFDIIPDDFAINDIYDCQISAMDEDELLVRNGFVCSYEDYLDYENSQYEEEMFWNLHYLRESQFEKPKCSCAYMDYMPNDDGFCDYLDCYDYPEGPEENLNGIKFY